MDSLEAYDVCAEMHYGAKAVARREGITVEEALAGSRCQEATGIVEKMVGVTGKIRRAASRSSGDLAPLVSERRQLVAELAEKLGLTVAELLGPS